MLIRNTYSTMMNSMNKKILEAQSDLYKTQERAMAQKKILLPSDSPLGTSIIMSSNKQLSNIESYLDNISYLDSEADMTDSIFDEIREKLDRISVLAVSGSTGTNISEGTMTAIREEISQLKETIVSLANSKYDGKYVFSGNNTSTVPFNIEDDGSITYHGTKTLNPDGTVNTAVTEYQRQVEISDGIFMSTNYAGDAVFGYYDASTDPPTGTGVFKAIGDLEAALDPANVDQDAIRAQIDKLKEGMDNVATYRTKNGVNAQRLELTKNTLEETKLNVTERKSEVQDWDVVEAYSKLSQEMYAYQASLQISSTMMNTSLLNYLS